jgi:hypothetical protein
VYLNNQRSYGQMDDSGIFRASNWSKPNSTSSSDCRLVMLYKVVKRLWAEFFAVRLSRCYDQPCNNQQSYGQMDVKHNTPLHAATPRIQVSISLYFTMHTVNATRYSSSTYFNLLPVAPHLLMYCILVIELLLLLSLFCLYSVSSLPKFFHGFAVEQLQCAPTPLNDKREGRR